MNYNGINQSDMQREKRILEAGKTLYDVIVIGGGMLGCDITLQLAAAGAKVLLLAHKDFGQYDTPIETVFEYKSLITKRDKQALALLKQRAAHLLVPTKMIYPQSERSKMFKPALSFSMFMPNAFVYKQLSEKELHDSDSVFAKAKYRSAYQIDAYKLDKTRLIIDTVTTAGALGATSINHMEVKYFREQNGKYNGVEAFDAIGKQEYDFYAKRIIYAPEFPNLELNQQAQLKLSYKCVYQAYISKRRLPLQQPVLFGMPEGTKAFAIPRHNSVCMFFASRQYSTFECSSSEAKLLKAFNLCVPGIGILPDDVFASSTAFKPVLNLTEKPQINANAMGLITAVVTHSLQVPGISQKILRILQDDFQLDLHKANPKLISADYNFDINLFQNMVEYADEKYDEAKPTGIPPKPFQKLLYRYGTQIDEITQHAYEAHNFYDTWQPKWIKSELLHAIKHEEVVSLVDYFARRTTQLYFQPEQVMQQAQEVAQQMALLLQWTPEYMQSELHKLQHYQQKAPEAKS